MAETNMLEGDPHRRLGQLAAGTVTLVRPWGIYVDLGLEHAGYIDPMFVQDDLYEVGDRVEAYIVNFREQSRVYELRPKGKTSLQGRPNHQSESDTMHRPMHRPAGPPLPPLLPANECPRSLTLLLLSTLSMPRRASRRGVTCFRYRS